MSITRCQNFTLGKPGNGNILSYNEYDVTPNDGNIVTDSTPSVNIVVQSNFFDTDTLGEKIDDGNGLNGTDFGITKNLTIGGTDPAEGNYINDAGFGGGGTVSPQYGNGYIVVMNNWFGCNYTHTRFNRSPTLAFAGGQKNSDANITISNNHFSGMGSENITLQFFSGNISINNNVFGLSNYSSSQTSGWGDKAIVIESCVKKDSISISRNTFSGYHWAVLNELTPGMTCRDNIIYCTTKGIIYRYNGEPVISVEQISPTAVSGKTIPNGRVQIFTTDSCTEYCENGQSLLANVVADNVGNFSYNGAVKGLVSALVTDSYGTTSEFNGVKIDTLNAYAKKATCGYNNGSITGIKIYNATSWYWEDSAGNQISKDTNVYNLSPGRYRILLFEANVNCNVVSGYFSVLNEARPVLDSSFSVTQPTCGQPSGNIIFTGRDSTNTFNEWLDSAGRILLYYSPAAYGIPPGKYYYRLLLRDDSTCYTTAGPLVLANQAGATLQTNDVQVTNASCGKANGSIKNITYQNPSGSVYVAWLDSLGNTVGNTINLLNVPAGKYQLKFKDNGGCDTITTAFYIVGDDGIINFDTNKITIMPASCNGTDGSITGITSTNATVFKWINLATGDTIATTQNIVNITSGNYQLVFKNAFGCATHTDTIFVSEQKLTLDTSHMQVFPSTCKGSNGSITGITSTNATIYTWANSVTGNTVSSNENLIGMPAGTYQLTCSNSYGCKVSTDTIAVSQAGFLADTVLNVIIWDANCNLNNGYITINQFTKDSSLYSFEWVDSATNNIISTNTNINNLTPGFYKLYATDTGGCKQQIFAARITQQGKPQFDYSQLKIISDTCNQGIGSVLFQSNNPNNYTWAGYNIAGQPQSTSPLGIINLTAGQYYATITDQYTCTATSDTFTVNNIDVVPPAPQAADAFIPRGTQATITVTNVLSGTYNLYDTVNATIPVSTSTTGTFVTPPVYYDKQFYIQYVQGDCTSPMQPVWVKVYDSTIISLPNAFSPNGDGINDTWHFTVHGIVNEYNLTVFNRYGQALYTSNDISKPWDGTVSGKPLPVGTYYYIIQAKDNNNKPIRKSGFVVLLR